MSYSYQLKAIQLCSEYATINHEGQYRKDRKTPYIVHPARVASLVAQNGGSYIEICAAWLHDILEDCSEIINGEFSYSIVNKAFQRSNILDFLTKNEHITGKDGIEILNIVTLLTTSQNKCIPKEERKIQAYKKIKDSRSASLIKYCDRIDNLITVNNFSEEGKNFYIKDTETMIEILENSVPSYILTLDLKGLLVTLY